MKLISCLMLLSSVVLASGDYPKELATYVGGPVDPAKNDAQCIYCHSSKFGGGTPTQKFGKAMVMKGLTGGTMIPLLKTAIDALKTDMTDSDGDGVIDYDEIKNGTNPNMADAVVMPPADSGVVSGADGGVGGPKPTDPGFGCNIAGFPVVLGALAGFVLARRRRS